ncbi:hypothetical protein [Endothiovibrio diazotrophicus]
MKLSSLKKSPAMLFLAGFAAATALFTFGRWTPEAVADQYSCIRTDLDAQGMTGNIPDPEFTITYDVPSCYGNSHYAVQRVYMYGDQVAVHYATTE